MDTVLITELLREGVWVVIKLCAPMLLLSMSVGVLLAIFQAVTQIHEQTLTFVPKVLAIALMLMVSGSWMITLISDLVKKLFNLMAGL